MDSEGELERLVEARPRRKASRSIPDALEWIVERLGGDRGQTRSEIDKLLLYKTGDDGQTVTMDDALAVLGDTAAIGIDDVVGATFDGNVEALDRALDRVFAEGGNPVQLVRSLQRHVDQLHLVSGHVAAGGNLEAALSRRAACRAVVRCASASSATPRLALAAAERGRDFASSKRRSTARAPVCPTKRSPAASASRSRRPPARRARDARTASGRG